MTLYEPIDLTYRTLTRVTPSLEARVTRVTPAVLLVTSVTLVTFVTSVTKGHTPVTV